MMREKLFLACFGIALGGALALGLQSFINSDSQNLDGGQFESIDDLRRSMLERDDRDLKEEGSVSLRSILVPHPSDLIMYHLRSQLDVKFQGEPLRTNSCGMRYRDVSIAKPENVFRIALLGDSFAFGWGVKREQSFASRLEQVLNFYTQSSPEVEVLNFGIPGYSTFQQVALFEETAADFSPDLVLVYFISNDFHPPFFIRDLNRDDKLIDSGTYAKKFGERGALPIAEGEDLLDNYLDPNTALKKLLTLTEQRGILTYLAINPNRDAKSSQARLWVLRKENNLRQIKMRHTLLDIVELNRIDIKDLSLPTDPHPSPMSHNILANILAENLFPVLKPWVEGSEENYSLN